jgi:nitrite reductase/ring-hydroxylating ferredoxin subunit
MAEQIRVAELSELEKHKPVCVEYAGVPYIVVKTKKGIKAFISLCSHKELAMFPPKLKDGCLICPHHKVVFDAASGDVVDDQGKDVPFGLPKVQTTVVDGVLYLSARKKHRKIVPKRARKWTRRAGKKRLKN